ncbi:hypothetical protein ACMDCR_29760 [Labrys okinawensis]|uniref:hypothetical protein n=1 Tax=Labrys okinawensis TaxID=346911 RepID=UPI0039BCDA6E
MWWDSQILWAGAAGLITATLSGLGALIYGRRQNRPAVAHANLPGAVEDLDDKMDALSDAFAQHVKDVNKDIPRISEEIITRLADLDDKAAANARALSELKGMLNAMMMARAR